MPPSYSIQTAASNVKYKSFWERLSVSAIAQIHDQEAFKTVSVRELLWGYRDPILGQLQRLVGKDLIKTDMFGIMYGVSIGKMMFWAFNLGNI